MAQENSTPQSDIEMSIWDHLEELRGAVIRAVLGIIGGMIICAIFTDFILDDIVLAPALKLKPPLQFVTTEIYGKLELYMQIIIWGGVVLSFPFSLIQIWKFVAPGLLEHERKYVRSITFYTILSFLVGLLFAYYVMLPMTLDFAGSFGTESIKILPDVHKYLAVFLMTIIISGIVFELPLVSYFLGRLGILTPPFMRHYRRHTIVTLLLVAAILSPGGNPLLQLILFIPLWILFELSIFATALAARQRRKKELAKN
ncbi:MAG: twin-arginine translocase subunit TatC [bacterium]